MKKAKPKEKKVKNTKTKKSTSKKSKDGTFTKVVSVLLAILSIISVFPIAGLIYFKTWGADLVPTAVSSTYVTAVTNNLTGETKPFIEVKYHSNALKNGIECMEVQFNGYSDVNQQTIYSRGFQMLNNTGEDKDEKPYIIIPYDSYDGVSFVSGHPYDSKDAFLVDIDGKTYGVKLDGTYTTTETDGGKIARTVGFLGLNLLFEDADNFTKEVSHEYTFEDFMLYLKRMMVSLNTGTGKSTIPLADLGGYFGVYETNDNGAIVGDRKQYNEINNAYFTIQAEYSKRGIILAQQSMFGAVNEDSNYNTTGIDLHADYWKDVTNYNLTEEEFKLRESTVYNCNYIYLPKTKMAELMNFSAVDVNCVINLDNLENCGGFDFGALHGLKLKSLTIASSEPVEFVIHEDSLKDTGILDITTNNVTLVYRSVEV